MTLYQNGYLVFTINGHDLTTTFYWSLLIITKEEEEEKILFKVKKIYLLNTKVSMTKRKRKITRKRMTIYCKP
jgi:hypothetical protein